ncbi:MAG: alcohol dehydrogenase (NADP+) [Cyclobacteriaceae bacterium]|jgi:alcohol dehydrogenase (NADP+)
MKRLTFSNDDSMPILGLGTWKSKPGEVYKAVREAIKIGFRHIDCAAIYVNEKEIGEALKDAFIERDVSRSDLWITSKLWNSSHKPAQVKPALQKTLADLQLSYLDLYLMHWPVAYKEGIGFAQKAEEFLTQEEAPVSETWKGLEDCKQLGLVRHIGLSNFNIAKLQEIQDIATMLPEMNQIELHPFLPQQKLVAYCHNHKIHLTAYSPFGSLDRQNKKEDEPRLFENEAVLKISETHNCAPAQILIAFAIARGIAVIPKSVSPIRLKQNFEAANIDLSTEELGTLLNQPNFRFIDGTFFTFEGSPYSLSDLWEEA